MEILHAIILGIIEGLTEFLPISSTGHMILAGELLKLGNSEFLKTFEIAIQFGAILSVVILFWKKFFSNLAVLKRVIVAFIPTSIIGLLLYKTLKTVLLGNASVVLWSLFLGGLFLIIFEKFYKEKDDPTCGLECISYKKAALIGVCQSVAIIPGVSRSAATILGGLALGIKREEIVEFSFLLAVPTMAAATGYDLLKSAPQFSSSDLAALAVGFLVSFLVAWAAVKWLVGYVQKNNFTAFGWYRIILAIVFWFLVMR